MTGIVEQAARVMAGGQEYADGYMNLAQALADAGLLAEPARTVPTRDEIAAAVAEQFVKGAAMHQMIDAIHALMDGQPTVAETKAQALEEFAETWATGEWNDWFLSENVTDDVTAVQATDKALHARAQQIRDGK